MAGPLLSDKLQRVRQHVPAGSRQAGGGSTGVVAAACLRMRGHACCLQHGALKHTQPAVSSRCLYRAGMPGSESRCLCLQHARCHTPRPPLGCSTANGLFCIMLCTASERQSLQPAAKHQRANWNWCCPGGKLIRASARAAHAVGGLQLVEPACNARRVPTPRLALPSCRLQSFTAWLKPPGLPSRSWVCLFRF